MLASLVREHPCELRADFQQYYNLNVDGMGRSYSVRHAADLAAMLPREARCVLAEDSRAAWSNEAIMLAIIDYRLQQIVYSLAGGKAKDGSKLPKPEILYKSDTGRRDDGMTVDEMREFLSKPRTVNDGN